MRAKRMHRSADLTKTKRLAFARRTSITPEGKHDFVGKGLVQTRNQKTSLNKEQAANVATQYMAANFPEIASRLRLKAVYQRVVGMWQSNADAISWPNGYLVQFSIVSGEIPIWENYASVALRGDEVQDVSFRYHEEAEQGATAQADSSIAPMNARDCLNQALPKIKSSLGIGGKYEVLKAELNYVNRSVAQGKKESLNDDFIPAWHLIVNRAYGGEGSSRKLFHVWIDASNGEFIGKQEY
jgi:hypothetical protein